MSDDEPKRDAASFSSVPPELRPFMGERGWPEAERRDEAEVDAAFAPVEAKLAEWQREADKEDAKRGVGNASEYVAPVPVPGAEKPIAPSPEPKVTIAITDVPRALPAGNPNLPTQEISTRALRDARGGVARDATEHARGAAIPAKPARTVGGNTEKLPAIAAKTASPWAKPSGATTVKPSALPSSHGPQATAVHEDDAPGSVTPARSTGDGRGRTTGLAITGAIVVIAGAIAVRAVTGTTSGGAAGSAITSAPASPPSSPEAWLGVTSVGLPSSPGASSAAPSLTPPTTSALTPEPSAGLKYPIAPVPKQRPSDDPFDAAPPSAPTAAAPVPTPQPTAIPAPAPSQKPVAPPTPSGSPIVGTPVY